MTNMSIQPLWLTHFIEIILVPHGFMHLLKKDTPFIWDDLVQRAFNTLKHAIMHAPILQPPIYSKDYSLYVVASLSTINMVLIGYRPNMH